MPKYTLAITKTTTIDTDDDELKEALADSEVDPNDETAVREWLEADWAYTQDLFDGDPEITQMQKLPED